jgi:hypothetical protein
MRFLLSFLILTGSTVSTIRLTVPNQLSKTTLINDFHALIKNGVGSESHAGNTRKWASGRREGIFLFLIGGGCPAHVKAR